MSTPLRQVRGIYTSSTITVYQAYPPEIAEPALAAGHFVAPFKRSRMTWIKPSFLWMMYRCGWAQKPDQERVLAIEITRDGFDYIDEWTVAVLDVTSLAHRIHDLVRAGDQEMAAALLPAERAYPLPDRIGQVIGASTFEVPR